MSLHEPLPVNSALRAPYEAADADFLKRTAADLSRLRDHASSHGHPELGERLGALLAETEALLHTLGDARKGGPGEAWENHAASIPALPSPATGAGPNTHLLEARVRAASAEFDFGALLGNGPTQLPPQEEANRRDGTEASPSNPAFIAHDAAAADSGPNEATPTRVRVTASGRRSGRVLTRGSLLIGRRDPASGVVPDLDLWPDTAVSRRHAQIEWRDGSYHLTDLASMNGTTLNRRDLPAHHPIRLRAGDVALLGDGTVLEFF